MIRKHLKSTAKKAGSSPGSLTYTADNGALPVQIRLIDYDKDHLIEKDIANIQECEQYRDQKSVTWVNIDGLHEIKHLEQVGSMFDIHPLVLEDVLQIGQRPKVEDHDKYIFIVLPMIKLDKNGRVTIEQISIILSKKFLITFQETPGDVFGFVRNRIMKPTGRIRARGVDYLAYAIVDAIVDYCFVILEKLGTQIEKVEESVVEQITSEILHDIHALKRDLIYMKKAVWPLREAINLLLKGDTSLIGKETLPYIRDVYDHTIQVIETVETFRDTLSSVMDVYFSAVSHKMNEVMKVLTIFASIFIPLTFIVGVYGMNFQYMPELTSRWGYPMIWVVMLGVAGGLLLFFRRKGWL